MTRFAPRAAWTMLTGLLLTSAPGRVVGMPVVGAQSRAGSTTVAAPTFEARVELQPGEDIAEPCKYELTLVDGASRLRGIWVIFERSGDTLRYYRDPDVRAFARRHGLALLYPFHCRSASEPGRDMNVDPARGLGRALFAAIDRFATIATHPELSSAPLIALGFSGTGSLVARLAAYAPDRLRALIVTAPGHFDPLGVDTIALDARAAAIPQLIVAGSADAITGTERPYAYFRRHFDQGAPWTFAVQHLAPHCCIFNAKALVLEWLEAVIGRGLTRATGSFGFVRTAPTTATDCPGQAPPINNSWCRGPKDTWGGANWSVTAATIGRGPRVPPGMEPAGWLPTRAFARHWRAFMLRRTFPVTMPP